MKKWLLRFAAVLSVLVVAAAVVVLVADNQNGANPKVSAALNETSMNESTITSIYATTSPAVVEIIVQTKSTGFGTFTTEGQGSGFVIDKAGYILTNNHVVGDASEIQVVFSNGNTETATLLGTDTLDDLAVIKVDASAVSGITPLTLADSTKVQPGQMAIAIGSPYGLTNSITTGIVSGLNRSVEGSSLTGMLQTDAVIQPGNSGGPLLDSSGQVIGINTAIEGSGTGIGFAVPSSTASKVLDNLIAGKKIERPWLGISGMDLTKSLADDIGLSYNPGVYIVDVVSGSPADKAGLIGAGTDRSGNPTTGGDIITAIDNQQVTKVTDLQSYVRSKQVGDVVTLTILRDGSTITVKVTLAAQTTTTTKSTPDFPDSNIPEFTIPWGNR
jgi:serine protease Do